MNEQILIGILTEMKEMKADMKEMKADMKEMKKRVDTIETRLTSLETRLTSLESLRKKDVRAINDILHSYEQGTVKMINEQIDKRMYM